MSDRKRRLFQIKFFTTIVVLLSLWNGLRLWQAIFFWKTLQTYGGRPLYLALSGGFWMLGGLILAWGFWNGRSWAWFASLGAVTGYTVWGWVERLVLHQPHVNNLFVLLISVPLIAEILLILFSPDTKKFFRAEHSPATEGPCEDNHGHESKDSTIA